MRRTLIFALVTGLAATGASAQEPLTVAEAVARTLAHNPSVRAAEAGARQAGAKLDQARSGYLPRVNVSESWQRGDQPVFVFGSLLAERRFTMANFAIDALNHPDRVDNFKTAVAVQQSVWDGARTSAGIRAAHLGVTIAGLEQRKLAAALTLGVTQAFGQALAAQAASDAAAAAVTSAEEDLRRTTARRDAGLETDANVLALQVHVAQMRVRKIQADSDATIAMATLDQTMGGDLDRVYRLVPPAPAAVAALDEGALEQQALTARPEVAEADAQHDLALASHRMARAGLLPQVGFQAGLEFNGATFGTRASSWVVGTQVSWNLFSGGETRARMREATAAADRADAERDRAAVVGSPGRALRGRAPRVRPRPRGRGPRRRRAGAREPAHHPRSLRRRHGAGERAAPRQPRAARRRDPADLVGGRPRRQRRRARPRGGAVDGRTTEIVTEIATEIDTESDTEIATEVDTETVTDRDRPACPPQPARPRRTPAPTWTVRP